MAREDSPNVRLSLYPFPHMLQTPLWWGFTVHTLLTRSNCKFSRLYLLSSLYSHLPAFAASTSEGILTLVSFSYPGHSPLP